MSEIYISLCAVFEHFLVDTENNSFYLYNMELFAELQDRFNKKTKVIFIT